MARNSNDGLNAIMFSIRASQVTSAVLQQTLRVFLESKSSHYVGRTTLGQLNTESGYNLDSVKISDSNIEDFQNTARKYNISYALKIDRATEPPTWFVYFKQDKGSKDTFERAFREFADKQIDKPPILERKDIKNIERVNDTRDKPTREQERTRDKEPTREKGQTDDRERGRTDDRERGRTDEHDRERELPPPERYDYDM